MHLNLWSRLWIRSEPRHRSWISEQQATDLYNVQCGRHCVASCLPDATQAAHGEGVLLANIRARVRLQVQGGPDGAGGGLHLQGRCRGGRQRRRRPGRGGSPPGRARQGCCWDAAPSCAALWPPAARSRSAPPARTPSCAHQIHFFSAKVSPGSSRPQYAMAGAGTLYDDAAWQWRRHSVGNEDKERSLPGSVTAPGAPPAPGSIVGAAAASVAATAPADTRRTLDHPCSFFKRRQSLHAS